MTPLEMAVALRIEYCGAHQLLDWITQSDHFDDVADDWQIAEILSTNRKRKDVLDGAVWSYFQVYDRLYGNLEIPSLATETIARRLLAVKLTDYVNGECKPYDVRKMVISIESQFDFPGWLGDLYNASDWVEPDTHPSDCPDLLVESQRRIEAINSTV